MKTTKRLFAILVAATLLFALTSVAFAAGTTGTITVMDADSHDYTAYKIFSVENNNGNLTYTAEDPWLIAILESQANGDAGVEGLQIDETTGEVTKLATFKAADFAKWAKDYVAGHSSVTGVALDATTKSAEVEPGYYLVFADDAQADDVASLCTVLADQEIKIQNKNDMPFDKKAEDENGDWVDETGVQVGDTVSFKITSKVPDPTYVYIVYDELTEGLELNVDATDAAKTVTVTIDGVAVDFQLINDPNAELIGNQIRITFDGTRANGFAFSLDLSAQTANAPIEITYSATVLEAAVNQISVNKATLEFGDSSNIRSKESETRHYTNTIVIDKYETGSPETKVPGAKFVLKNEDGKFYAKDANGVVSWVDANATTADEYEAAGVYVAVTDAEGGAAFAGIADGTYYLVEVEAPAGYAQLTDEIEVVVDGSAATALGMTEAQIALALSEIVHVNNTPGTLLPSTGGIGTQYFYIGGALLIVAAIAVIIVATRKKQTKSN